MIDLARSARATSRHIMMKIRFPERDAEHFRGAKVGISFALIGAIVGEFVAGEIGLGYVILTSQSTFNTPRTRGDPAAKALSERSCSSLSTSERWLLPWHVPQRRGN